jgi:anti-anti-sigma factor
MQANNGFINFSWFFMVPKPASRRLMVNMGHMGQTPVRLFSPQVQLCWTLDKESKLKLSLEVSANGALIVVSCKGRLVYRDEAAVFFRKVAELLPRAQLVLLDLSQVEKIDGSGLGHLLNLLARARGSGCALKLVAPSRRVRELLELTNLSSVFEIHPTLEGAISSGSEAAQATCSG